MTADLSPIFSQGFLQWVSRRALFFGWEPMTFAAAQDKNVNKVVGPPYKLMKYFYFMSLSDVKQLGIKAMLEDIAHFKNGCKIT